MSKTEASPSSTYNVHHVRHELRELIEAALLRSGCLANRDLCFEVHDAEVVLRGVVHSYYQKQVAQEALRPIAGSRQIQNKLEVLSAPVAR